VTHDHFAPFALPEAAEAFLLALWEAIQGLDDWHDGTPADTFPAIWACLVQLPGNPFLAANASVLVPVMANMVLKWVAANTVEDARDQDQLDKAYVWRAGYYDVVLQTVLIVHGKDAKDMAVRVMKLYGETRESYLEEFTNA